MNKAIIIFSYYYYNSTRNDHIFVNFADHGAPGLVAFPAGGYVSVFYLPYSPSCRVMYVCFNFLEVPLFILWNYVYSCMQLT